MTIEYEIGRRHLFAATLRITSRNKPLWLFCGTLFVAVFVLLITTEPEDGSEVSIFVALVRASLVIVAMLITLLLRVLFQTYATKTKGILGVHRITLDEEGLTESTDFNSSLTKWGGLLPTIETRSMILIPIAPGIMHVVPRNAFSDRESATAFLKKLEDGRSGNWA